MNSHGGCLFADNPDYVPNVGASMNRQRMEPVR